MIQPRHDIVGWDNNRRSWAHSWNGKAFGTGIPACVVLLLDIS